MATFSLTATGSGYYRVFVDGSQVSQHSAEREAIERAVNEAGKTDKPVYYDHNYRVDVTKSTPPVIVPPVDPPPPPPVDSSNPVSKLLFSDLTHAPKSGWSADDPDRGAAVSVWHRDLGTSDRGRNLITVNGALLSRDADYAEWNAESYDVPFLRRTTFWLNSSCHDGTGKITLTVDGLEGESIPFNVVSGSIHFIDQDHASPGTGTHDDPWSNPTHKVINGLTPGSVTYFRQTDEPYTAKHTGGIQNFYLSGAQSGTTDAPISVVSYPGETCEIIAKSDDRSLVSCWWLSKPFWTVAKFRMSAHEGCVYLQGHGCRAVGNDCNGCTKYYSGTGVIHTFASQHDVLGNSVHGSTSENRLDHGIYVSGDPSEVRGCNVGWNYLYDNNYSQGAVISVNHQSTRIPVGKNCKQHDIHDNVIDCVGHPSVCMFVYQQNWEPGNPNNEPEPEPVLFRSNTMIEGGFSYGQAAIMHQNGKMEIRDNKLIDGQGHALLIGGDDVLSTIIEGNDFQMTSGYYLKDIGGPGELILRNNKWSGGIGPVPEVSR